jgi:hypothetical protein
MKVIDPKGTVVGAALEKSLVEVMSNLPKMNAALQDEDTYDTETVRKMIVVEMRTKRRPATLGRLLGRFKTLLSVELDREVMGG